jgi:hypothetical protein
MIQSEDKGKLKRSSEELFIDDFLDKNYFDFEAEKVLPKLKGDEEFKYRRADFYLKNYKVYIEYFGLYNSTKEKRAEYDKKVEVYIKNNIPTVFLYPHELGIIEYSFHVKLLRILKLKKFNFKKQLFMYRLKRFVEHNAKANILALIISFVLGIGIVRIDTGLKPDFVFLVFVCCLGGFLGSSVGLLIDIWKYFIKDR